MASLVLGTSSMASQLLSLPSSLSVSRSYSVAAVSQYSPSTLSPSVSTTSPPLPLIYCGRGDRKTAKGKRFNHSFGNARPRDKKKGRGPPKSPAPPSPKKRDPFDTDEFINVDIDDEVIEDE